MKTHAFKNKSIGLNKKQALLALIISLGLVNGPVYAQFDPFPGNTIDCTVVCSPACDDSSGGVEDPFCELLGTCEPDCDPIVQSCAGDGDGDGDGGCEGATCGDTEPCGSGTADGGSNAPNGSTGNPINIISGNKYKKQTDLEPLPGVLGLEFSRHYNSAYSRSIGLGVGWRHSYSTILWVSKGFAPGESEVLKLQQADGRILHFDRVGDRKRGAQYRTRNHADGYITTTDYGYQWRWRSGRIASFDERGLLTQVEQNGQVMRLRYNGTGRLIGVRDPQGRRLTFYYEGRRLAGFTDPAGNATQFKYDKQERLVNVIRPNKSVRVYHYQDPTHQWHLTGITDERGHRVQSYGYDERGRAIVSTKDVNTEKVTLEYDDDNDRRILTDSQGVRTEYLLTEVEGQKLIGQVRGPGCSVCEEGDVSYEYNSSMQVVKQLYKGGRVERFVYDQRGRLIEHYRQETVGDQERLIVAYEYSGNHTNPSVVLRPSINPNQYARADIQYNQFGQVVNVSEVAFAPAISASSASNDIEHFSEIRRETKIKYDSKGNVVLLDGPRDGAGDSLSISYDHESRVETLTLPNGMIHRILEYNQLGLPVRIQNGQGLPIIISYNEDGKPLKVEKGAKSIEYSYDAVGNLISILDPYGRKLLIQYDDANRAHSANYEHGPSVELDFDDENRIVARRMLNTDGRAIETISYLYDAANRLTQYENDTEFQLFSYDDSGELEKVQSGDDYQTLVSSSVDGLVTLTQPGGRVSVMQLDQNGELLSFKDAKGNVTRRIKDDFGRVVAIISPDTGLTKMAYDSANNLIRKEMASGEVVNYQYDDANRLIKRISRDYEIHYRYHPSNGRISEVESADSLDTFVYDVRGNLIDHGRVIDGHEFNTLFTYDDFDRVVEKVLPNGLVVYYHYYVSGEMRGELRAITRKDWFGFTQTELISEIDTNKWDGVMSHHFGNGVTFRQTLDNKGKTENITIGSLNKLKYEYDQHGKILKLSSGDSVNDYKYDLFGRLTSATVAGSKYRYEYDQIGNAVKSSKDESTRFVADYSSEGAGNRIKTVNGTNIEYNPEGSPIVRVVNGKENRYEYTVDQRLKKLYIDNSLVAEYFYNGFGERIKKVTYGLSKGKRTQKITYFLYDGSNLVAEADEGGNVQSQYLYLKNKPAIAFRDGEAYYITTDHIGTPIAATDDAQRLVWKANYSPFGEAEIIEDQLTLNLRFPGQYHDEESGTHYNYFRDYDPYLGRYQTSDPIGLAGGVNTYAYAGNDPINHFDRLGLMPGNGDDTIVVNGVSKPIAEADYLERLEFVMIEAGKSLVGELKQEFERMLQPESLVTMAIMMGAITALQAVPGVGAVVDAVLLGWAWWNFGSEAIDFILTLIEVGVGIAFATKRSELCQLGRDLGKATADVGLAASDIVSGGSRRVNRAASRRNIETGEIPQVSRIRDVDLPDLPSGYTRRGNDIVGPRDGVYRFSNQVDAGGHRIYENNGKYYTFVDGKKTQIRSPANIPAHVVGLIGEQRVTSRLESDGWTPLGNTQRSGQSVEDALPGYQGQQGIDGIYKRGDEYVIVETKSSQSSNAGGLDSTNDGTQLSENWIRNRVEGQVQDGTLSRADADRILAAQDNGTLKVVKADVTNVRQGDASSGDITFREVNQIGDREVSVGGEWSP